MSGRTRLSADERRVQIIDASIEEFSLRGWGATTTASISARADVNEALLFRYVGPKQALYVAAIDAAWDRIRNAAAHEVPQVDDAQAWRLPGRAFLHVMRSSPAAAQLWARALSESTGVKEIDHHLAGRMQEVHDWVSSMIRTSGDAGGLREGADPEIEAWIILALGWLGIVVTRIDGRAMLQFEDVLRVHRSWIARSEA